MQLAQKVSISLDPAMIGFMQGYVKRNHLKSRSSVIHQALRLLEQSEKERELEAAYRQSAPSDLLAAQEFASAAGDGLADEAW